MKKIVLILAACVFSSAFLAAQETTTSEAAAVAPKTSSSPLLSKKGETILPQQGDIAVGMSATPILFYFGNILNNTANNPAPTSAFNYQAKNAFLPQTFYLKYFLEDNAAVRIRLAVNNNKTTTSTYVADDVARIDPLNVDAVGIDKREVVNNNLAIGAGYEMRRGRGRLQGLYGGEVMIQMTKNVTTYEYYNDYSDVNTLPSIAAVGAAYNVDGSRPLEVDNGSGLIYGLSGFLGGEYYFMPNLCIGTEMSLNFGWSNTKRAKTTVEWFNGAEAQERPLYNAPATSAGVKGSSIQLQPNGVFYLMFNF